MPELPEVETGRRLADRYLVGRKITGVYAPADTIVFDGTSARRWARVVEGRTVQKTRRKGKYIWFELDRRPWPLFHFGMTGSFVCYESAKDLPRFCKVELTTSEGTRLAMINKRRLGRIRLLKDPENEPPVASLGLDPYLDVISTREIQEKLAVRKAPIKAVLLDQKVFAGVGNWIADEVLYQAGIHPARQAHTLSPGELGRLHKKLKHIIHKAVDVSADSDRFPRSWLFHHRWGKNTEALTARGEPISFDTIAGRTTAWVPSRQQ